MLRDPEFGPLRLRAFGTYAIRVTDPALFLTEIVGTDGEFTMDEISFQIRNIIVQEVSRALASSGIPVLDMAANTADLGKLVADAISGTIAAYGLTMPELYIENISLPPAVEKALDKRTSLGIAGNLDDHMKWKAAEAMGKPGNHRATRWARAWAPGWAWHGAGRWASRAPGARGPRPGAAAHAAPPPPPVEHVWHIAENGQTQGPVLEGRAGPHGHRRQLTRDTLVWTAGQDGWKHAGDVTELAQLFTVMPPPPPPPPPAG